MRFLITLLLFVFLAAPALAAVTDTAVATDIEKKDEKTPVEQKSNKPASPTEIKKPVEIVQGELPVRPFGSNLFSTQFAGGSKEPMNPNYQIVPGDQIDIQVWGAADLKSTTIVDNQGNIFLPDVGPVHVQGVTQAELNSVIKNKVSSVYKDNVELYTNLRGSLPVSVFVSGAVTSPGRYVGTSADSIIDYILKAGGIDAERGSYRSIKVMRNNLPVQEFDIYDFLLNGTFPKFQIKEGDTILVTQRGQVITANGSVKNLFKFEFKEQSISGADLMKYASPLPEATNALIVGTREGKPFKSYISLDKFASAKINDGDQVTFTAGQHEDKIEITISGRHAGPKAMIVPIDAKLVEVLNNIPIDKNISDSGAVFIRRKSVAIKQQAAIDESIHRLEETLLLARASGQVSSNSPAVSEAEVKLLDTFVEKAKLVKPEGRVVVSGEKGISNIILEEGDEIVIPQKTDLVMVNGEVRMPRAIVWESGDSAKDYIKRAGGFTDRANEGELVIVKANGEAIVDGSGDILPGDEIMVLPEVKVNNLELATSVVDILYKVAIAAIVPFSINN